MQPITRDALPALAGAAVGTGAVGAVLALADIPSPVRAPFTFFFLAAAPGAAFAALLAGLDPLTRVVVAAAASVAVDLLVAEALLALHLWSVRGGVAAVAAVSAALFLAPMTRAGVRRAGSRRPRRAR